MARLHGSKDKKKRKPRVPEDQLKTGRLCGIKCTYAQEDKIKNYCFWHDLTVSDFLVKTAMKHVDQERIV